MASSPKPDNIRVLPSLDTVTTKLECWDLPSLDAILKELNFSVDGQKIMHTTIAKIVWMPPEIQTLVLGNIKNFELKIGNHWQCILYMCHVNGKRN